ncbi:hypothetical protein NDU88_004386 [Pleurodeles waltl]|uniref:Uncharacterized protein n=1 Tax=Pleurodeles waltl TaxID=8319 RepID=A0AAV7T8Z4_PLEWA|nr:hypothetical protein NDU88_004386 [Pleurodeles waltl]
MATFGGARVAGCLRSRPSLPLFPSPYLCAQSREAPCCVVFKFCGKSPGAKKGAILRNQGGERCNWRSFGEGTGAMGVQRIQLREGGAAPHGTRPSRCQHIPGMVSHEPSL